MVEKKIKNLKKKYKNISSDRLDEMLNNLVDNEKKMEKLVEDIRKENDPVTVFKNVTGINGRGAVR